MVGGGFDLVKFTLNPPKLSRDVRLSGQHVAAWFACKTASNNAYSHVHEALLRHKYYNDNTRHESMHHMFGCRQCSCQLCSFS